MGDEVAPGVDDPLGPVRVALGRHAWQDAASAVSVEEPVREADRLDLGAEAARWLGRLDECIAAREAAYRTYDELGEDGRAGQCAVWLREHHAICARPAVATGWLRRQCPAAGRLDRARGRGPQARRRRAREQRNRP